MVAWTFADLKPRMLARQCARILSDCSSGTVKKCQLPFSPVQSHSGPVTVIMPFSRSDCRNRRGRLSNSPPMLAPGDVQTACCDQHSAADRVDGWYIRKQQPAIDGRANDLQIIERCNCGHWRPQRGGHEELAASAGNAADHHE